MKDTQNQHRANQNGLRLRRKDGFEFLHSQHEPRTFVKIIPFTFTHTHTRAHSSAPQDRKLLENLRSWPSCIKSLRPMSDLPDKLIFNRLQTKNKQIKPRK